MYILAILISVIIFGQDDISKDTFNWFGSVPQVITKQKPQPKPQAIYQQPKQIYYYRYPITQQYCSVGGT